jgi:hypothetical protein
MTAPWQPVLFVTDLSIREFQSSATFDPFSILPRSIIGWLAESGVESVKLPPRSPNLNASLSDSSSRSREKRMIFLGEDALRTAIREYLAPRPKMELRRSSLLHRRRSNSASGLAWASLPSVEFLGPTVLLAGIIELAVQLTHFLRQL